MGYAKMNADLMREVEDLENVIFVCFGQPSEMDLPQVANEDGVIIDLVHHMTGAPYDLIQSQIHHQIDPSYI